MKAVIAAAAVVGVAAMSLPVSVLASHHEAPPDHRVPFGGDKAFFHYPRYHEYQLDNVKIVVSFDEIRGNVVGDVTNTVTALHPNTSYFDFDSADLHYSWVRTSGNQALRYKTFGETLRVFLANPIEAGTTVSIEAKYATHPTKGIYFVRPDRSYPDRPWEVWSQGEMTDSHYWFPTYDWPDIKATSETVTTVPEGQTVLSNGRLTRVVHDKRAHTVTYDWVESVPHSTYLISIVAGTFAQWTDRIGSIPVTYYAPPKFRATVAYDFRSTPKMLDFFARFNGFPYPYDKYAQAAVVNFTYGGMENISATTQSARTLHDRRAELDDDSEGLIAHELAHQWWGDLETMQDWGQVWLNEGYATYYEALYRQFAHGEDAFAMDRLDMMQQVFDEDEHYRRPIVTERYYNPIDVFDAMAYPKAALVLHMLRSVMGTEMYRQSQTSFLKQYAAKNANTEQWKASLEKTTGQDWGWFVKQWLYQAGFPEYTVAFTYDEANSIGQLTVDQTQSTKWNTPAVFKMPIVIETKTADGTVRRMTIRSEQRHQVFGIPSPSKPIMVLFDPGHNIVSKVSFKKSDDELEIQMMNAASVLDRLDAAQALIAKPKPTREEIVGAGWFLQMEPCADARAAIVYKFSNLAPDKLARAELRLALADRSAHVRAAAAGALGNFPTDPQTITALKEHAASDRSYATIAASVRSLAQLEARGIRPILLRALSEPSYDGQIASAALFGYSKIDGKRAIPLEERYARYGAPLDSRRAAIRALGRIGGGDPKVTAFLTGLLGDPDLVTNFMILESLSALSDPSALPAVERLAATTEDQRLREASLATVADIEAQQHSPKKVAKRKSAAK